MKIAKLKNRAFIIDLHIYSNKIFVVIGDIKQLKNLLLSYKYPPTKEDVEAILECINDNHYAGKCLNLDNGNIIIHIQKDCGDVVNTITHEILHSVRYIMKNIGMGDMSDKNDEGYCYLNGYINEQIFKQL